MSVSKSVDAASTSSTGIFPRILQQFMLLLFAGVLLSGPALLNGFPLMFYDTSSYLTRATAANRLLLAETPKTSAAPGAGVATAAAPDRDREPYQKISDNPIFLRPLGYSLMLAPFALPVLFFLVPIAQGAFSAYVVWRVLGVLGVVGSRPFLLTIAAIAVASSLPIHVSQVMPDLYTGLLIAMAFVLTVGWPSRSWAGRVLDVGLIAGLGAVHLSHVPILFALIVASTFAGVVLLVLRRMRLSQVILANGALASALALTVAALVGSNMVFGHKATLSESSPLFMLARLTGDGPAVAYLEQACPTSKYLICSELTHLKAQAGRPDAAGHFLWDEDGVAKRLASPRLLAEASEINSATMRAYPTWIATTMVKNAVLQLVTFQVDSRINSPPPAFVVKAVDGAGTGLRQGLLSSRQAKRELPLLAIRTAVNLGLLAAVVAIGFRAWTRFSAIPLRAWQLGYVVLCGLLANALATGGLSEAHDRYQNRVIWLVPLLAIAIWLASSRPASETEPQAIPQA